jgi:hypothetical protein
LPAFWATYSPIVADPAAGSAKNGAFQENRPGKESPVEPRVTRLAKNEALFREVNERIAEITAGLDSSISQPESLDGVVCECSDAVCMERVGPISIGEYEKIRSDPRRFIIAPGHQAADVEDVVEEKQAYWIVEKHEGVPADVARERDPRS